jgi:single-strand DNA-binding protein
MAGSLNKVTLLGNLARDPEVRFGPDGRKIVTFSVATSEQWRDKATGEKKEKAEFHRVVIFNDKLADVAERFLKKGRKVYLEGKLQTRKWTDTAGQEKYTTEVVLQQYGGEIVLCDGRQMDGGEGALGYGAEAAAAVPFESHGAKADAFKGSPGDDFDDDVPF